MQTKGYRSQVRILISGAAGRMGCALTRTIAAHPDTRLVAALEETEHPALGQDAGEYAQIGSVGIPITHKPLETSEKPDVIIDFSTPQACCQLLAQTQGSQILQVIGVTGFDAAQQAEITQAAKLCPIVQSGNMSLGVNLLSALVEQAARILGENFDIEILDLHHKQKVDAPSGTALLLGQAAARGRNLPLEQPTIRTQKEPKAPREPEEIGIAVLRGGGAIGEHQVWMLGESEALTFTHRAMDRELFAKGALHAALWGQGKKPGLYSMADVLGIAQNSLRLSREKAAKPRQ